MTSRNEIQNTNPNNDSRKQDIEVRVLNLFINFIYQTLTQTIFVKFTFS